MAPAEPLSFAAAAQNKVLDGADGKRRKFSCSPSPPPHPPVQPSRAGRCPAPLPIASVLRRQRTRG